MKGFFFFFPSRARSLLPLESASVMTIERDIYTGGRGGEEDSLSSSFTKSIPVCHREKKESKTFTVTIY